MQTSPLPPPEEVSNIISSTTQQEAAPNEALPPVDTNTAYNRYDDEINYVIKTQFADSLQQNRRERIKYAKHTFWLTISWITVVLVLVTLSGITHKHERLLKFTDTLLITLITTTTVNVFAFFILVMQFLFNKEELNAISSIFNQKKNTQ